MTAAISEVPASTGNWKDQSPGTRLSAIDVLRGIVMIIMALDHTRDFFSSAHFDPTDLTRTTPLLFFTRWITHFCAPIFVILAGAGAYLSFAKGKSRTDLAAFLATRGLWLVFLEVAVIGPLGWSFRFDLAFTRLQVIWAIGVAMIVLSGSVLFLSPRVIGFLGLAMVLGHNLLDGSSTWSLLHSIHFFEPLPHKIVASLYPLIPWIGVMALGYGGGQILLGSARERRRTLLTIGLSMIALFVILRGNNLYGDPKSWVGQHSGLYSLLSVLNCTKYPPSLAYLLMTLGPALCFLAMADWIPDGLTKPLTVFGRVPLFYYLLHLPLIHGLAVLFAMVRYGQAGWLFQDMMAKRGNPLPADYGYDLWVVYLVWATAVLMLYPACRWFASLKRCRRHPLLSYL